MIKADTGEIQLYWPGENCWVEEQVFIPRSDDAPEGDGFVMFELERRNEVATSVVILDTDDRQRPVAVVGTYLVGSGG